MSESLTVPGSAERDSRVTLGDQQLTALHWHVTQLSRRLDQLEAEMHRLETATTRERFGEYR